MDKNFNFIRVNRAYARSTGYNSQNLVGRNHFELFPNPENEAIFHAVVKTGKPFFAYERKFSNTGRADQGISGQRAMLANLRSEYQDRVKLTLPSWKRTMFMSLSRVPVMSRYMPEERLTLEHPAAVT